jgi:hypothetical protein
LRGTFGALCCPGQHLTSSTTSLSHIEKLVM